jgi:tricorn protease
MKERLVFTAVVLTVLCTAQLHAQIDARMLREPDVSNTHIAFIYAGDIWVAPKAGGVADRLTTAKGEESLPRFSPDGSWIAFSGNYDGNTDVYSIPAMGGMPRRVTHDPKADRMLGWYPDGKQILFASAMESGSQRFNQLYRVAPDGGMPEKLPVPYGEFGAISPDGKLLAYMPQTQDYRTWKYYRGGWAPDIWLFNLQDMSARNITNNPAIDSQPMWHGRTLYFLSDRGPRQRMNIWACDIDSGKTRQVTQFDQYDIHFPSIGPSDIVFEAGGRLYLLDLKNERSREVKIEVVTDRSTLKPANENVSKRIFDYSISPTGKRVAFEARGDVFTVPEEHGALLNLTRTSGIAERSPAWSPDGKYAAYWSDRSGEYELTIRPADGSGEEEKLTSLGPGFRYHPYWSPDSRRIAFIDQAMNIRIYDRNSKQVTKVDQGLWMFQSDLDRFRVSWSSDSRWMAYSRGVENRNDAIFLYDTQDGTRHQVTAGFYDSSQPVFDPDGKYLYFFSNRSFRPLYSDTDTTWIYANSTEVLAVPLLKDIPSPLAPRDDAEKGPQAEEKGKAGGDEGSAKDAQKTGEKPEAKKEGDGGKAKEPVKIDLEGFELRAVILPPKPGNYSGLTAASGKVTYLRNPRTGAQPDEKADLVFYDLKERKEETVIDGIDDYQLSADTKKIVVRKDETFSVLELKPKQRIEKPLRTGELEATVDPAAEWRQIFNDVWRFERDYFYDPNMHGVDWNAMKAHYGSLLDAAVTRWDVNYIIGELISELNSSHTYRGGGAAENAAQRGVGMLGVNWALENGAYRIKTIIRGAQWDEAVRSPLLEPGVNVKEGEYVLAVNNVPVDATKDPWASFQGLADQTIELTVNDRPSTEGARKVLVKTLASEDRLRYLNWIESMRLRVDEATGGRVGYVYVPSTGVDGQNELMRQFRAQFDKEGLIIDERFNSGGQIPDRFIELLGRKPLSYWAVRDGKDWQWPPVGNFGPKVMLINGWSGSGGDAFPYYFRETGLGPLIGMRTWGGLIGISGVPPLIDGGSVTAPTFRMYGLDGKWFAEGHGVDPDIEVVDDPSVMAKGKDPQLERAVQEVMRMIAHKPPVPPKRPPYQNRAPATQ